MKVDFELFVNDFPLLGSHQHPLIQILVLKVSPSIFIVELLVVVSEVNSFVVGHVHLLAPSMVLFVGFLLTSLLVAAYLVQFV